MSSIEDRPLERVAVPAPTGQVLASWVDVWIGSRTWIMVHRHCPLLQSQMTNMMVSTSAF